MRKIVNRLTTVFLLLAVSALASADVKSVRWTGADDKDGSLDHVVATVAQKTGYALTKADFLPFESRDLATSKFDMYYQVVAGLPVSGMVLRTWKSLNSGEVIQVEAQVQDPNQQKEQLQMLKGVSPKFVAARLNSQSTLNLVRAAVSARNRDDKLVSEVTWRDMWGKSGPERLVTAKGRRGKHHVVVSLLAQKVVSYEYKAFATEDTFDLPAMVFPIYEETDDGSQKLERVPASLKNIKTTRAVVTGDPYAPLRSQRYFEDKFDPVLGETEQGRAQGFWSGAYVKRQALGILGALPQEANSFANGGVVLEGKYITVSLHPAAKEKFQGLNFEPGFSPHFRMDWHVTQRDGQEVWEMTPTASLFGKRLTSYEDALRRPARRLADHDPVGYINDGFDEVQVYYAVDRLVQSLREGGFTDPELSTRAFNAFLYDPDISMRDNAYYTDDTINFTTYSPKAQNYARDNSTIWHELGHGVMDRLMGDQITLADTGGLSEGMADFVAALVVADVSENKPFPGSRDFRIINNTGFMLTNEVHDDGEAYGGSMKDLLDAVLAKQGQAGLKKVADLTMETMRLTRNHPGLTAPDWFSHMLFADSLGREGVRAPGELSGYILAALGGRNFNLEGKVSASFTLKNGDTEVLSRGPGSRGSPVPVKIAKDATATYSLSASLQSTDTYKFQYPVKVRVGLRGGPIQGAVHWVGEESEFVDYTLNSEADVANIPLTVTGTCDAVNRDDGSCVDFAYIKIFEKGKDDKPVAKKRFYLRISNP